MRQKVFRVGVLSTADAPYLGYLLNSLATVSGIEVVVLFDRNSLDEKQKVIELERTEGKLPPIPLHNLKIAPACYFVGNHNGLKCIELVKHLSLDVLINGGTPRILKADTLGSTPLGVLNCHPGLLPEFRGCTCVEWALYLNQSVGSSVHLMSEKIDEGPLVLSEAIEILPDDQYSDIRTRVYLQAPELYTKSIVLLRDGLEISTLQIPLGGQYYDVIPQNKFNQVLANLNDKKTDEPD